MKSKFAISFFIATTICVSSPKTETKDPDVWLNEEWLTKPKLGESRPSWWFDVWDGDGALVIAKLKTTPNIKNKFDWFEVIGMQQSGQVDRAMFRAAELDISEIVNSSKKIKSSNIDFSPGNKIKVYTEHRFLGKPGLWSSNPELSTTVEYIFFLEYVGMIRPGELYIKWHMAGDRGEALKRIVESSKLDSNRGS